MSERVYQPRSGASEFFLGEWHLCVHTNSLQRGDTRVELENRLVMLLLFFIDHQGEVLDKERIIKTIWPGKVVNDDSLAVAISHLRKALGDNSRAPAYIKTIPGVGYQLIANAKPFSVDKIEALHTISSAPAVAKKSRHFEQFVWLFLFFMAAAVIVWFVQKSLQQVANVPAIDPITKQSASPLDEIALGNFVQAQTQIAGWEPEQYKQAIQTLRDILLQHPGFAPAYASMAEGKIKLLQDQLAINENCAEVLGLLDKAIALDQQQASAWLLRGNTLFWCKRDYAEAEHSYQQAIQLNANNDQAPMQYAQLLLAQGRFAASLQQVDRARQLNPLNYSVPTVVWIYQMQKRDDLALQELQRITTTEPDNRYTHISAQRVYERLGRSQESFDHLLWLMRAAGYSADDLQQAQTAFARAGLPGVNSWLLARKDGVDLGQYTPPLSWARYALAAGELAVAMDYIEQAFAARQSPLLWASVDPAYDPLRSDPRFQMLIAHLQQPESPVTSAP
jgi:DNA-binding winged helix-turn-helix (wHTH) protein/tetratricopeptide (TPR) repeat protein